MHENKRFQDKIICVANIYYSKRITFGARSTEKGSSKITKGIQYLSYVLDGRLGMNLTLN